MGCLRSASGPSDGFGQNIPVLHAPGERLLHPMRRIVLRSVEYFVAGGFVVGDGVHLVTQC